MFTERLTDLVRRWLAEPYPPLPKTDENPDILHVTRTWLFLPGGELIDD
jgi:protein TonB